MIHKEYYSKTCVKQPLSKRPKIGFQDQLSLNAGQKASLGYHLSLRSLFCLFLSGCFAQVLLDIVVKNQKEQSDLDMFSLSILLCMTDS